MLPIQSFVRTALLSAATTTLLLSADGTLPQIVGVANFRDIGGYQTIGGQHIKPHEIFRSGELSGLTPADDEKLASLHIRYEFDLRTDKERSDNPSHWGANPPDVISLSVGEPRNVDPSKSFAQHLSEIKTPEQADRMMQLATARLAIDGAPEIGRVLHDLAQGDEPALIHCTAGKDRTGVTIAVLMTILGVPRPQVDAEYMRSNEAVDQQMIRMRAREHGAPTGLSSLPPDVSRTLMGTKASYIEAAFTAMDRKYGSFDNYVSQALKLAPEDVSALRSKLLEQ